MAATALAIFAFTGTAMNLSWVQEHHNSDSLLVALISLVHYEPFYWSENRFGQPIPLVTSFIHDYTANLFAQTEIIILAGIGCVVLFNLYFLHRFLSRTQRLAAAMLSLIIAFCIASGNGSFLQVFVIGAQPYTQSLFPLLLGLVLLFRAQSLKAWVRLAGLAASLLLAFWINASLLPVALGFIVCLDFQRIRASWQLRVAAASIAAVDAAVISWLARRYPGSSELVFQPIDGWVATVRKLWGLSGGLFVNHDRFIAFLLVLGLVATVQALRGGIAGKYELTDLVVFFSAAICFALAIAGLEWVKKNLYDPRYWTISCMFLFLPAAGWIASAAVRGLTKVTGSDMVTVLVTGCLLLSIAIQIFGFPSYGRANAYLDENVRLYEKDLRSLGCTHLVGSYWFTWTAVFERRRNGGAPLYAITPRAGEIRYLWDWGPERRRTYCDVCGDPDMDTWRRLFGLAPFRETERSGGICRLEEARRNPVASSR